MDITADNLNSLYQSLFGRSAPQSWVDQTLSAYGSDPTATMDQVTRDTVKSAVTGGTPFSNVAGDPSSFTSGAAYYQKQGYVPGSTTYEGVPTSFIDPKTGKVVASYGSVIADQGGTPTSRASNDWTWNQVSAMPQGYTTANAVQQRDYNTGLLDALKGIGFVAGTIGGAAGLASLGEAGALGDAGGAALGGGDAGYLPEMTGQELNQLGLTSQDLLDSGLTPEELGSSGLPPPEPTTDIPPTEEPTAPPTEEPTTPTENPTTPETPSTSPLSKILPAASTLKSLLGLAGLGVAGATAAKALSGTGGSGGTGGTGGIGSISDITGGNATPAPTSFNWNYQQPTAPVNGIAYGQQILNPQYLTLGKGLARGGSVEGGLSDLGGYSDGGRMLKGPGDGMSDSIPASISGKRPARLATDEFVIPADVVSHLGNGSSDAGAKVLYHMMDRIRKARTGSEKQGKRIDPNKFVPA
jgi:hypothetical protein